MASQCESSYYGPSFTEVCPGSSFFLFMSLVDAIFRKTNDVADPCGRIRPRRKPDSSYDFIVVGGGPGGATTAGRLAQTRKWKVLLLEAGIDEPTVTQIPAMTLAFGKNSFTEWGYNTEPEAIACQGMKFQMTLSGDRNMSIASSSDEEVVIIVAAFLNVEEHSYKKKDNSGYSRACLDKKLNFSSSTFMVPSDTVLSTDGIAKQRDRNFPGNPEKRCDWPRAKILGGCGVHNAMKYLRGIPKNYNDWADEGNEGWSYEDVLPVFKRSEGYTENDVDLKYHGTTGPMTVGKFSFNPALDEDILKAAEEIGLPLSDDLNGRNIEGFEIAQVSVRGSVRLSAAKAFLRPQRNNPKLHVMLNSTVTKILINKEKTAVGVEFVYRNRTYSVRATKEIILSAGTMNTPQLLLLSGVGPKDVLDRVGIPQLHELPGVGKNLSNHVAFTMSLELKKEKNTNLMNWQSITQYLLDRSGPLASAGLQIRGRLNSKYSNPDGSHPNLFFTVNGLTAKCSTTGGVGSPLDPENPDAPRTIYITPLNLQPLSRGYISLRSKNPLEALIMVGNYFAVEEDMDTLLEAVRITLRFTNSSLQRINMDYDFWKCSIGHSTVAENHQTSTCRMGPPTDRFAVVDNKLRVYGIKKLRIADASIMPKVVSGNTHASVVMIGERVVDFIKEHWLRFI
ncbi:glucose dehydrogenase [FAD, quinone] [Leptinotarsa decemlineata]|uniref:glucose dehydrogenase [FAD, quinone] n=1 Tax=Leptinotarsa decemlineata TaxID=7539 RepID=UPI003D3090FB